MEIRIDIGALPLRDARREFERQYLGIQLSRFNGNVSNTARFVGMERSAFHRKIKDLSVKKPVTTPTPYGVDEIAAILIAAMDSTDECLGHVDKWRSQSLMHAMSMKPRKLSAVLS